MNRYVEKIGTLCSDIENELYIYQDYVSGNLQQKTIELVTLVNMGTDEYRQAVGQQMREILIRTDAKKYTKVWIYSAIYYMIHNVSIMEEFLEYVISESEFSANIKYYLYWQIRRSCFIFSVYSEYIEFLQWKLFEQIINLFRSELKELLMPIPVSERDESMALVIIGQMLGNRHAPSRRCLDRCRVLVKMGKKVLLINSAEVLSFVGAIPYCMNQTGNYLDEFLNLENIEWKDVTIPFFQCEKNMTSVSGLRLLLQMIRKNKPGLVISVGGSNVLSELINTITPVLTIGMSASSLEVTMSACQTLSKELQSSDLQLLRKFGMNQNNIIRSISNFTMPEQLENVTKKDLGLPENKFIIVVAGSRLNWEIDEQFINMLCKAVDYDLVIALIGIMDISNHEISRRLELENKVYYLGYTESFLAWMEVCDLYVNPCRRGGGTMSVMALVKGKPVVTVPYGDAAINVGKDFWTESYDTMPDLIRRYKNDPDFYNLMSEKAKERADVLTDADNEFWHVLEEFKSRTKGR